jgi:ribonuclease D
VLDCEGYELGDKKGQLTIIQVIPNKPQSVSYIIDVLALQPLPGALQPLKQLLSDASITKILHDCRNDSGALWHEQQCKLQVSLHAGSIKQTSLKATVCHCGCNAINFDSVHD